MYLSNLSFKYRFILTFVFVEIFFIILIVGMNFFAINNTTKELINKEITSTKHLLKSLVKLPISVYDLATLDDISQQSIVGSVNSIIIFDANDNLLSKNYNIHTDIKDLKQKSKEDFFTITEDKKDFEVHKIDITQDDISLGHILLIFDTNEIKFEINENKTNTILIILIEILISTIISYFLGINLTNKLSNLTLIAQKIGNEEEVDIKEETSKNEVSILTNSIAKMYQDINIRNEKLKEAKIVFDNIKEAIVILDKDKNVLSANDSFYNITGYKAQDIKNKNFFKEMYINIDDVSLFKNSKFKEEVFIKKKDYSSLTALLNISLLKDEQGNIKNFIIFFIDITDEKRKEELLQMQSKMATMGEMIGNIAHQWRQPLSAISTAASSMQLQSELDLLSKNDLEHTLSSIIKSTRFLSETIEDFRNFFRTDKNVEEFNIDELFSPLEKIIFSTFKYNNINFEITKSNDNIVISGFKNELVQALLNIINNAKDALITNNTENKFIKVDIEETKNDVFIRISDNAGGIPEKILPKIFEPYFTTKHQSQGTGIGLYMTHTIITQHFNGTLIATNNEKGALFTIKIPKNLNLL